MSTVKTGFLHYSAPPVVGGVEAVMEAHARIFAQSGYPVTVIAGQGDAASLPEGTELVVIPEMDTQHPRVLEISAQLEAGSVPDTFAAFRDALAESLRPVVQPLDLLIVHNVFSKHFNLPLTAALFRLMDEGAIRRCLAWTHDLTWTSPNSRSKVYDGYPWDLLRTGHRRMRFVAISEQRRQELVDLLSIPPDQVDVIYNGVDPLIWFGLSPEGYSLAQKLDLLTSDLILLMPVRITQAKNIEFAGEVLAAIKARGISPRLVVTGPPDPHDEGSMAYYHSLLDLRSLLDAEKEMRFVFECGEDDDSPYLISPQVVADLLRVSDVLFLPSHREGFGMPVLEAGLIGVPVVCSDRVPAGVEIGGKNVYLFNPGAKPDEVARLILDRAVNNASCRFRREVRQNFTWEQIFRRKIVPYLEQG